MSGPAIPTFEALTSEVVEDIDATRLWLASEDVGERALSLLVRIAAIHAVRCDRRATEARLRFVQLALARGADPNRLSLVEDPNRRSSLTRTPPDNRRTRLTTGPAAPFGWSAGQVHEINLLSQISIIAGPNSLIDLLIRWGADFDHRASKITKTLENGGKQIFRLSALAYTIRACDTVRYGLFRRRLRAVAIALLRGGASLDSAVKYTVVDAQGAQLKTGSKSIEWVLAGKERQVPSLASDAHYLAFKAFLLSVRAAGGYRSFVIEQRRSCALMRHLALRDRATTRDGVLKFLARTGERGLFRRVLSYLSPPPPQPTATLNIRVRRVETEEQTFFSMKSTIKLMKVFRAYATRRGVPVDRLVFSLPASPDVLIEGCQTIDDLGLAEGSVIDATLCHEHPARLREQSAAAAAIAAAAARRYLEDLAGAEVEETAAETGRRVAARE